MKEIFYINVMNAEGVLSGGCPVCDKVQWSTECQSGKTWVEGVPVAFPRNGLW